MIFWLEDMLLEKIDQYDLDEEFIKAIQGAIEYIKMDMDLHRRTDAQMSGLYQAINELGKGEEG